MNQSTKNVTLGSSGVTLSNRKTTAVGEKLTHYSINECTDHSGDTENGHYFNFQGVLSYENSGGSTNTVGALVVNFDKYFVSEYSYTPISKSFQLNYSSRK